MMSRDGVQPPPPAPIEIAVPRMRVQLLFLRRSTVLASTGVSAVLLRAISTVVLFGWVTRRGRVCPHTVDRLKALVRTKNRILVSFRMGTIRL